MKRILDPSPPHPIPPHSNGLFKLYKLNKSQSCHGISRVNDVNNELGIGDGMVDSISVFITKLPCYLFIKNRDFCQMLFQTVRVPSPDS